LIAAALLVYAGVTAFKPSVMRATLMGLLLGLAGVIERKTSLVHLVTISLIILLFFDPRIVFNVSAQLSYGAVYGILLLMPFFERKLAGVRCRVVRQGLLLPLAVSFSAQLFTAPILAYYFNRLPTMSLLANLVIVPLSAIAVTVGFLVAVVHPVSVWLAGVFSGTLELVLTVMVFAARIFGGASFSVVKLATPSVLLVALCYFALASWRWRGKFLVVLLGMFNVAVWARAILPAALSIYSFEDRNYLALLPSGQSLALIRQPGPRWQRFLDEQGIRVASLQIEMPRYRRGSLSLLCVTAEQPGGRMRLEFGSVPRVGYGAAAFLVDSSSTAVFSDGRSTSRRGSAAGGWARLLDVVNFIGVEGHWPHFYVR
jgi:ComEC/Rec2-related protein